MTKTQCIRIHEPGGRLIKGRRWITAVSKRSNFEDQRPQENNIIPKNSIIRSSIQFHDLSQSLKEFELLIERNFAAHRERKKLTEPASTESALL